MLVNICQCGLKATNLCMQIICYDMDKNQIIAEYSQIGAQKESI